MRRWFPRNSLDPCPMGRIFLDANFVRSGLTKAVSSQRHFWALLDLVEDIRAPSWPVGGDKFTAARELAHLALDGQHRIRAVRQISQRNRLLALKAVYECLDRDGDIDISTFASLLKQAAHTVVRPATRIVVRVSQFAVSTCPSTREWVLSFVLCTGCPPPSAGSVRTSTVPANGGWSDSPSIRPSGLPGAATWHCRGTAAQRCPTDRHDCRPAFRDHGMAGSDVHVRRARSPRRWGLESSRRPAVVASLRVDRGFRPRQCQAA